MTLLTSDNLNSSHLKDGGPRNNPEQNHPKCPQNIDGLKLVSTYSERGKLGGGEGGLDLGLGYHHQHLLTNLQHLEVLKILRLKGG